MSEKLKKVNNPLFSASVTGSTIDEFSRNALLFPAEDKLPTTTIKLSPEELLNEIIPSCIKEDPQQETFNSIATRATEPSSPLPDISCIQPHLAPSNHQSSNISAVISSFTNILNIRNNNKEEFVAPPPAGIENLISQVNNNQEPVPLFSADTRFIAQVPPPSSSTAPANVFRRSGLKRPTYAPIPGLSNISQPSPFSQGEQSQPTHSLSTSFSSTQDCHPSQFQNQANNISSYFPSISPTNSITSNASSKDFTPQNQFKPISPPPPNFNTPVPLSQPQPLSQGQFLTPQTTSEIFIPEFQSDTVSQTSVSATSFNNSAENQTSVPYFSFSQPLVQESNRLFVPKHPSRNASGLVMDAVPASEIFGNSDFNNMEGDASSVNTKTKNYVLNQSYRPVYHHWFYEKEVERKKIWEPFSMVDSLKLEGVFTSTDLEPDNVAATDGGRYDVNILRRQRVPVYWKGEPTEVRRCSWFHKDSPNGRLVPYDENIATKLEEEYKQAFELNQWHRKVELPTGETVVFHGPDVLVLFPQTPSPDAWGNTPNQTRPSVVKRGMDEFDIDEGESTHVDHILFMVHGIGSVCDLKWRSVEETVDEFRDIALQLVRSHYKSSCEKGIVNRVEVLPISWHDKLHSEETGIDDQLKNITLESIPKLRDFTNDTILDVLFYTSPFYCQNIISSVGNELNRIYDLYKERNPDFKGGVSLGGHSLGSLILFDLLCHQYPGENKSEAGDVFPENEPPKPKVRRKISRTISYLLGSMGTGQPQIYYPHLNFSPNMFFALGSPIGMFVIVRGLDILGENFFLPTCPSFFNIFHPYDPIAYRFESLIHPELGKLKPVLIPHHKGRKRMHLELKETMARVGADLKQKVVDSIKSTWDSFYQLTLFHKPDLPALENEMVISEEEVTIEEPQQEQTNLPLGRLNSGRRIDYVLQEAPFEFINEYIFALTSHVCYWQSEDTILMMLREIYASMDITTDSQLPQQTMTIERPPPSPTSLKKLNSIFQKQDTLGMDPTTPIQSDKNLAPPPTSGFFKKA